MGTAAHEIPGASDFQSRLHVRHEFLVSRGISDFDIERSHKRVSSYNAAAVMLRRLLETLIIEAYEHLSRELEIKDASGNYLMLSDLAERASSEKGHKGLNLGRDSKKALKEARNVGNWSAHARRFLANAGDLTKFQAEVRVLERDEIKLGHILR